jgi:hypothetical protein
MNQLSQLFRSMRLGDATKERPPDDHNFYSENRAIAHAIPGWR